MTIEDWIHPGPAELPPGGCPGGVIVHVYAVPSGLKLCESKATSAHQAAVNANHDHDFAAALLPAGDRGYCLVAYDGDTGQRFVADDWTRDF